MKSELTEQILALSAMAAFIGLTAASLVWYPEKAEVLLGAWILLVREMWREYFVPPKQ